MPTLAAIAVISYLLGSIPFGYLLVKIFRGEDVRQSGSGNIGATNVSRKSPLLGALTLVLDALKGSAAVLIACRLSTHWGQPKMLSVLTLAALFAVMGHMFPIWLKFRGGKGVATGLGSYAVIAPKVVLLLVAIFLVVIAISRYVSLASIVAVASLPIVFIFAGPVSRYGIMSTRSFPLGGDAGVVMLTLTSVTSLALMWATSLLIIAKHHENIRRLLAGTENRIGAKRS